MMESELEMIPCEKCEEPMPKLRKTQFGYTLCIRCNNPEPYGCVHIVAGKTDYTIQVLPLSKAKAARKRTFF